jgi:hypothetical protein
MTPPPSRARREERSLRSGKASGRNLRKRGRQNPECNRNQAFGRMSLIKEKAPNLHVDMDSRVNVEGDTETAP